jgi:uncharacterized protein
MVANDPMTLGALVLAGLVAGALNVVAGGGSFLTLPLLIFLGLPAGVANATNRVGIFLQNIGAVWTFDRQGVLDRGSVLWAAVPSTLGSVLGTALALKISDQGFEKLLAAFMILLTLFSFWSPRPRLAEPSRNQRIFLGLAFFVVGVYGGMIQAGVGFLMLAATSLVGIDLVRGNAIKVLSALCFTTLSLIVFAYYGKIDWPAGLALGLGNFAGGFLGAHITIAKGHAWLRAVVSATVILFAIKLLW